MPRDQVPSANVPTILNETLETAGIEESKVLHDPATQPEHLKGIQIKSRTAADDLRYGFAPGGPYVTIHGGQTYAMWNLDIGQSFSVYLVGTVDGQVAEIEVWR